MLLRRTPINSLGVVVTLLASLGWYPGSIPGLDASLNGGRGIDPHIHLCGGVYRPGFILVSLYVTRIQGGGGHQSIYIFAR
jgi:hypothetical protein